jgi:AmmeMemoRadiSam system protein B
MNDNSNPKIIREPICAGSWYPGNPDCLAREVDGYMNAAPDVDVSSGVKALIVPHAGYIYSGAIAGAGFGQLSASYTSVFLLGPSHRYPLRGVSIPDVTHYRSPLGDVPLSPVARNLRVSGGIFYSIPHAHASEHSLEIELPFLQRALYDFELVPMLVGEVDTAALSTALEKHMNPDDLLVVSVDLSHFHSYDQAKELDDFSINCILELDSEGILSAEIDAPWAVSALLILAEKHGWKPVLTKYANSGDVTGDRSSVVGYASIAFTHRATTNCNA